VFPEDAGEGARRPVVDDGADRPFGGTLPVAGAAGREVLVRGGQRVVVGGRERGRLGFEVIGSERGVGDGVDSRGRVPSSVAPAGGASATRERATVGPTKGRRAPA
jgi:hypothetical protein